MKKILSAIVTLLLTALCLASCSFPSGTPSGSGNKLLGNGVTTTIITSEGVGTDVASIESALYELTGKIYYVKHDGFDKEGAEIVIGNTSRDISAAAQNAFDKKLLREIRNDPDEEFAEKDLVGFGIYATGNSVALVWNHDEIYYLAVDYLIENILNKSEITLTEGFTYIDIFSISEYRKEKEDAARAVAWQKLESDFIAAGCTPEEAAAAVLATRNHYTIFDDSIYLWLANLYDPESGGFYYSNSARNTEGFLPDIESTFQAINYLCNTGFLDDYSYNNDEKIDALPEWLREKLTSFMLSRQSSVDGYFYHPQWETVEIARMGRDLNWASSLLEWLDVAPLYNTPTGMQGSLGAPTGVSPTSLSTYRLKDKSAVGAASKVIATASVFPEQLQTLEAFEAYLDACDLETNSYYWGHTLSAQASLIRERGAEFVEAYERHFSGACRSDNGLWEEKIGYDSTNGLMKIIATYNSLELEFPYPEQAIESALTVALLENEDAHGRVPNHACDVYNVFYAIDDVLKNVQKFGDSSLVKDFRAKVIHLAPEIISKATVKAVKFRQPDGGYAYNQWGSNPTSQGCPVAVPGSAEGDVNGNTVATNGIIGNLYGMLGVTPPRIYYNSDYIKFIETLESLGPVIKNTAEVEAEPVTFDSDPLGTLEPTGLEAANAGNGTVEVVVRPGQDDPNDHALLFTDDSAGSGSNTDMQILPGGIVYGQSRNVFQFDILVESAAFSDPTYQCWIGESYMFTMTANAGRVYIKDQSANSGEGVVVTDLDLSFTMGEWHTLRFEYYQGTHDSVRTKIFIDGYLRAVSTNYYGNTEGKTGTPSTSYTKGRIYTLSTTKATAYLDNIFASKDNVQYKEETPVDPNRIKDFESGEIGSTVLTQEVSSQLNGASNTGFVTIEGDPAPKADNAENKVVHYYSDGGEYIHFPVSSVGTDKKNCFVFEFDIYVNGASSNDYITQIFFNTDSGTIMGYTFKKVTYEGKSCLALMAYSPQSVSDPIAYIPFGEWTNIRIEYYRNQYEKPENEKAWTAVRNIVYVNGDRVASDNGDLLPYYNLNVLSKEVVALSFYTMSYMSLDCYFDNVIFEKISKTYVDASGREIADPENPEYPLGGQGTNTPAGANHNGVFDFDGEKLGLPEVEGLTTVPNSNRYGNDIEIVDDPNSDVEGDNALLMSTTASNNWNFIYLTASKVNQQNANCNIFELDLYIENGVNHNAIQIFFKDKSDTNIIFFTIYYRTDLAGGPCLLIHPSAGTNSVTVPVDGVVNLRFESYSANGVIRICDGDQVLGEITGAPVSSPASVMFASLSESTWNLYLDNIKIYSDKR